jgi:LmbE family N-acetylglucosaminyl deacetylase
MGDPRLRILTVYAHPDDESFGPAAILARWVAGGAQVYGLWFTRGERGQVSVAPPPEPRQIARWREQDLREAAALIGYRSVEILDYADGSLDSIPQDVLESDVLDRLRGLAPEVVLTFGPAGITRHPDHVAVHRAALAAFDRATAEGLAVAGLYYDAVLPDAAARLGIANELDGQPNTSIDVTGFEHVKRQALAIHARHVVDAANRLRQLEKHPLLREALFEARNLQQVALAGL